MKVRRRYLVVAALALGGAGAWLAFAPLGDHAPTQAELWLHKRLMEKIAETGAPSAPFASDGCSGGMSEAWSTVARVSPGFLESYGASPPWVRCCLTHDRTYWSAGNTRDAEDSASRRLAADDSLRACVIEIGRAEIVHPTTPNALTPAQTEMAYGMLAEAMFQAVRLGGLPCSGLPWRWGFGYPDCAPGQAAPVPRDKPGAM